MKRNGNHFFDEKTNSGCLIGAFARLVLKDKSLFLSNTVSFDSPEGKLITKLRNRFWIMNAFETKLEKIVKDGSIKDINEALSKTNIPLRLDKNDSWFVLETESIKKERKDRFRPLAEGKMRDLALVEL